MMMVSKHFAKSMELMSSTSSKLHINCSSAVQRYISGLHASEMWALRMLDAGGKIQSGILNGNSGDLGTFDECINVVYISTNSTIYGKYCIAKINVNSIIGFLDDKKKIAINLGMVNISQLPPLTVGTCFPHVCSASEIQNIYSTRLGIEFCHSEETCQTKFSRQHFDGIAVAAICLLASAIIIVTFCTLSEFYTRYSEQRTTNEWIAAFSAISNFQNIFCIRENRNDIPCIYGLRVFSTIWIMLGHRYYNYLTRNTLINKVYRLEWLYNSSSSFITGSKVAVDTFFVLSGILISYNFLHQQNKGHQFVLLKYYVRRYMRITPAYAACIIVNASLLKYLGSGPMWFQVEQQNNEQNCRNYWWSALLYIQNYVNPNAMCMGNTWYLSVDTQLFCLSPLVLTLLMKDAKKTVYLLSVISLSTSVIVFSLCKFLYFNAEMLLNKDMANDFNKYIYTVTHFRATPWIIGFLTGYLIHQCKENHFLRFIPKVYEKVTYVILWIPTLIILFCSVYYSNKAWTDVTEKSIAMNMGFVSLLWSIAVCYLIFACFNGYGGVINWILSNKLMQILSTFTYSMYLLHNLILAISIETSRTNLEYENAHILLGFCGDFVLTLVCALFWMLAFEFPCMKISNIIFSRRTDYRALNNII